jgi:hypothetical protein
VREALVLCGRVCLLNREQVNLLATFGAEARLSGERQERQRSHRFRV